MIREDTVVGFYTETVRLYSESYRNGLRDSVKRDVRTRHT